MDLTLFVNLKEKLKKAQQFGEIWTYFFDHFLDNPDFMAMGKSIQRSEMLEAVLAQVAGRLLKTDVARLEMRLFHIPQQSFIHGCGTLNGQLTSVIYFEEEQMGVFNIVMPDNCTQMGRFSGRLLGKPGFKPSNN